MAETPNVNQVEQRYEESLATFKVAQAQLHASGKLFIQVGSLRFFDENPGLTEISWNQLQPNFDDGDYTSGRVENEADSLSLNGDSKWDSDEEDLPEELFVEIAKFLSRFPDDFLFDVFGEGVTVTVNREGVTTEDYYDSY